MLQLCVVLLLIAAPNTGRPQYCDPVCILQKRTKEEEDAILVFDNESHYGQFDPSFPYRERPALCTVLEENETAVLTLTHFYIESMKK